MVVLQVVVWNFLKAKANVVTTVIVVVVVAVMTSKMVEASMMRKTRRRMMAPPRPWLSLFPLLSMTPLTSPLW